MRDEKGGVEWGRDDNKQGRVREERGGVEWGREANEQ